jgi:hypothetical protein
MYIYYSNFKVEVININITLIKCVCVLMVESNSTLMEMLKKYTNECNNTHKVYMYAEFTD